MSDERYHKPDCESLVCLRCLPPLAVLNDPAYIELRTALTASQDRVRAMEDENVRLLAEVAREHELFLIAHRDNIKGAALLADAVKRREVAESEVERLKAEKDYDGKEVLAAWVAALTKELDTIKEEEQMKDRDFLVVCAVRYCLGRQSYIVSAMTKYLIAHAKDINSVDRRVIIRDIDAYREYGASFDKSVWMKARAVLEKAEHTTRR